MSSEWDLAHSKKMLTVPSTSATCSEKLDKIPKMSSYLEKENTRGIFSETDTSDAKLQVSTNKSRLNIFNFRNTIKIKHKSDTTILDATKENNKSDKQRRWSEINNSLLEQTTLMPGSLARLICEWPELMLGEIVTILKFDSVKGYLVQTSQNLDEMWLPTHVLSSYNKKQWPFRFRKSVTATHGKKVTDNSCQQQNATKTEISPEFVEKLKNATVPLDSKIVLKCEIKPYGKNIRISWRKTKPNQSVLRTSGRFSINRNEDGVVTLQIDNVQMSDAGSYACIVSNEIGSVECHAVLTVTDHVLPLQEPIVEILSCSSVTLFWNTNEHNQFIIEFCRIDKGKWLSPNNGEIVTNSPFKIENLTPGESYSFRVICVQNQSISLPSSAVTLPIAESMRWQQEHFKKRYFELEEIGKGRYASVHKARDRGTGHEVALKEINRRKQSYSATQAEYNLLVGMQHQNIIHALALFENAPTPGTDTIVLELVKGKLLVSYLCQNDCYTEYDIKNFFQQLVTAIDWLHNKNLAHLDIKPENVMVELSNVIPIVKLVDFGDCVNADCKILLPSSCLEFASPELVSGKQVGKPSDVWAAGVLLYVLLSGVSPFLDDSEEETTSNILKCDYCFPVEHFKSVSDGAKEIIKNLLVCTPLHRFTMEKCLESQWFLDDTVKSCVISSSKLQTFMRRRSPTNLSILPILC